MHLADILHLGSIELTFAHYPAYTSPWKTIPYRQPWQRFAFSALSSIRFCNYSYVKLSQECSQLAVKHVLF